MDFITDDRAQALQVGAVLLFGILIILFSFWQAFVIPEQNEEVEFNHNQEVQEQMTELRSTAVSMTDATTSQSSTVNLGVRYPTRMLFVNPSPSAGHLRTTGTADPDINLTVTNARATDGESAGVGEFWNGTEHTFNTGGLEYLPRYSLFQTAPRTVYEHSVAYNEFDQQLEAGGNTLPLSDQAIVNDERLTILTLTGEVDDSAIERSSVDFQPVSTQSETVMLEQTTPGEPITIELPTQLDDTQWEQLLMDEPASVVDNEKDDLVEIQLDEDQEVFSLKMARIGVGTQTDSPDLGYVSGVSGPGLDSEGTVTPGQTYEMTVDVRNTHNVPERFVNVEAEAEEGSFAAGGARTNDEGEVTFEYTAPSQVNVDDTLWFNSTDVEQFADTGEPSLKVSLETGTAGDDPSGSVFDVEWDVASMDNEDEFTCDVDNRTCTIRADETGEMDVNIFGAEQGTVEYAVTNSDAGAVDPVFDDFDAGFDPSTDFEAAPQGAGETSQTQVSVLGGGDSDTMTINVEPVVPDETIARYVPQDYDDAGADTWPDWTGNYDLSVDGPPGQVDYDGGAFDGAGGVEVNGNIAHFVSDAIDEDIEGLTVFVVYENNPSGDSMVSLREDGSTSGVQFLAEGPVTPDPAIFAGGDVLALGDAIGDDNVGTFTMGAGGDTDSWHNGQQQQSGGVGDLPWEDIEIGIGADADGSQDSEATVGEVLVVGERLDQAELDEQHDRLMDTYNIDP